MSAHHAASQADLFATSCEPPPTARKPRTSANRGEAARTVRQSAIVVPAPVVLTEADMPRYDDAAIALVDAALAALPPQRLWFTYRDVEESFGISRATIVRRLREELVPGVRIEHGRLLADGSVRRLDRNQVRWLLLAVRRTRLGHR